MAANKSGDSVSRYGNNSKCESSKTGIIIRGEGPRVLNTRSVDDGALEMFAHFYAWVPFFQKRLYLVTLMSVTPELMLKL